MFFILYFNICVLFLSSYVWLSRTVFSSFCLLPYYVTVYIRSKHFTHIELHYAWNMNWIKNTLHINNLKWITITLISKTCYLWNYNIVLNEAIFPKSNFLQELSNVEMQFFQTETNLPHKLNADVLFTENTISNAMQLRPKLKYENVQSS